MSRGQRIDPGGMTFYLLTKVLITNLFTNMGCIPIFTCNDIVVKIDINYEVF